MKVFSPLILISIIITQLTPSYAAEDRYIYKYLKGNYLTTYMESSEKKIKSAPNIFLNNNLLFIYSYEDTILAQHRPVDTYNYLKKSKKEQDSYINTVYKLSRLDKNRYGSYIDRDSNDGNYIIEGRYNKKSFMIVIPEYGRHYIGPGVTNSNLLNRDNLLNKLPYFKTGENSSKYTPPYLKVMVDKSEILYNPESLESYIEYEGEFKLGCNKIKYENFGKLPFSGLYLVNKESILYLSVSPLLPGVRACE